MHATNFAGAKRDDQWNGWWHAVCAALLLLAVANPAAADGWHRYQIIVWQSQSEAAYAGLRTLGVTAGALIADREHPPADGLAERIAPLHAAGLRWYVENIATDFYAPYHRWQPGHAVNWRYDETVRRWRADPADPTVFWRVPSLSDPVWLARIQTRLAATVAAHAPYHPLFYDLGDETGIADLTSAWDFDRSPPSLVAMRVWLSGQYRSLDALNREWGSSFASWDDVVPQTTFEAMRRSDENFAAWSDFKAWMDVAFGNALRAGTRAVHAVDPSARAGIEGAQRAGWGGYDYATLAPAVDVMETFGDATNVEIAQDMNPALVMLDTAYGGDRGTQRGIWQSLLRGSRGVVLWDPDGALVRDDGTPGPRGIAMTALFSELRGMVGAVLLNSTPVHDPVAILYSPVSFRAQWMLEHQPAGDAWVARGSAGENDKDAWRLALRGATHVLLHLGIRPRWIAPEQLARGLAPEIRLLLLPHAIAMSDGEARAVRAFAARGGSVLADVPPGTFDGHARRRAAPPVDEFSGVRIDATFAWQTDARTLAGVARTLAAAHVVPHVTMAHHDGSPVTDVELRLRQVRDGLVVSLLRDGNESGIETVVLGFAGPTNLQDLRRGMTSVATRTIALDVSPETPIILLATPSETP